MVVFRSEQRAASRSSTSARAHLHHPARASSGEFHTVIQFICPRCWLFSLADCHPCSVSFWCRSCSDVLSKCVSRARKPRANPPRIYPPFIRVVSVRGIRLVDWISVCVCVLCLYLYVCVCVWCSWPRKHSNVIVF